ncbi:TPA: hypothetical protein TUT10_002074, partial [Streptococcus equi subsp. zooepidemicus]|nr:hypothetical protein [Streptococcus equi subsp. zooepidemicus]
MKYMLKFASCWKDYEIVQRVVAQFLKTYFVSVKKMARK